MAATRAGIKWKLNTTPADDMIKLLPRQIDDLGNAAAEGIVADIVLSFGTSPPGRIYTRGKKVHVASVKGYPPNVDIGTLAASIHWSKAGRWTWRVADGVIYGLPLEIGTETIGKRPFMTPIFEQWRREKLYETALKIGLLQ